MGHAEMRRWGDKSGSMQRQTTDTVYTDA